MGIIRSLAPRFGDITNDPRGLESWLDKLYEFAVPVSFIWTPVLTFSTPGDLTVDLSTQAGVGFKCGKAVTLTFDLVTSTFTHTTASGSLTITGLPYPAGFSGSNFYGTLRIRGYTNASYSMVAPVVTGGGQVINFTGSGSGVAGAGIMASDMPTGGTVVLRGTVIYIAS